MFFSRLIFNIGLVGMHFGHFWPPRTPGGCQGGSLGPKNVIFLGATFWFQIEKFCAFVFTHFSPKWPFLVSCGAIFGQKTKRIKCFQSIQSKISQFGTKMWLPKKLHFLVPGTPPDPPIPPLTPPRGPGGPKMAKMHSLKSNNDNQCQKSHFRGVKNFNLFFHSECPNLSCHGHFHSQEFETSKPLVLFVSELELGCSLRKASQLESVLP